MEEYPALVYVYNEKGRYDQPLKVEGHAEMIVAFKELIWPAVRNKQKVIITDMLDLCLFHAENGTVLHPEESRVAFERYEKENR